MKHRISIIHSIQITPVEDVENEAGSLPHCLAAYSRLQPPSRGLSTNRPSRPSPDLFPTSERLLTAKRRLPSDQIREGPPQTSPSPPRRTPAPIRFVTQPPPPSLPPPGWDVVNYSRRGRSEAICASDGGK